VLGAELPSPESPATSRPRSSAGLPRGGHGEEHLRQGCFLLLNTGDEAIASVATAWITTCAAQAGTKQFALEGSVFTGGAVVQWLRDGLRLIKKSVDVEKLALSVSDSGGVYLVPAFTGLGAPHWTRTRAAPSSVSRAAPNAGHIARAAFGIDRLPVADLLHAMELDSGQKSKELRVDGGAARRPPHAIPGGSARIPVVRPRVLETRRWEGDLAGLASGVVDEPQEIAKQ